MPEYKFSETYQPKNKGRKSGYKNIFTILKENTGLETSQTFTTNQMLDAIQMLMSADVESLEKYTKKKGIPGFIQIIATELLKTNNQSEAERVFEKWFEKLVRREDKKAAQEVTEYSFKIIPTKGCSIEYEQEEPKITTDKQEENEY